MGLLQVPNALKQFQAVAWWSAANRHVEQEKQKLLNQQALSNSSTAAASSNMPVWLQNVFKPVQPQGAAADANLSRISADFTLNPDMVRTNVLLQHVLRVADELKLIQNNFKIADIVMNNGT